MPLFVVSSTFSRTGLARVGQSARLRASGTSLYPQFPSTNALAAFSTRKPPTQRMDEQQYHPDFPAVNSIAPKTTPSRLGVELRQHVERGGSLTDKRLPSSAPRSPLTAPKKYARPQRKPARATPKGTEEVPVTPAGKAGEGWRIRKQEQKASLEDGKWAPKKRVARSTMERIRFLAINMPDTFDIPRLSYEFKISFEAVRRILRSNFNPSPEVIQTQESKRLALRKEYWSATQEANQPKPPTLPQPVTIITQRPKPKS